MDLSRKINVIGEIDDTCYREFVESFDGMVEMLDGEDIYIELCSDGGRAIIALAFYDKIRAYKGDVHITATGEASSAAIIILAAGDTRAMTKNAWVLVHEDVVAFDTEDPRVTQAEKNIKTARRLEDQWNKLLASRTKVSAEKWAELHKSEAYLSAEECLKLGLINKIV